MMPRICVASGWSRNALVALSFSAAIATGCGAAEPTDVENSEGELATESCNGIPAWKEGTTALVVQNKGSKYTCKVAGWCSLAGGAAAYEPGVGWAWQEAWSQTALCATSSGSGGSSSGSGGGSSKGGSSGSGGNTPKGGNSGTSGSSGTGGSGGGSSPSGTVYFQDTGTKAAWSNYPQKPQGQGTITEVNSPSYKGTSALKFTQTYLEDWEKRYHSEVIRSRIQATNQDRYYGLALYLPNDFALEQMKDVFQQWAPDDNSGPWMLMWMDRDHIRIGVPGSSSTDIGAITRGQWHRIVVRIDMRSAGAVEVWVNGAKKLSRTNVNLIVSGGSIRWSAGLYVSYWWQKYRDGLPAGSQRFRTLYQDHHRVASTYAAAEPANW